MECPICPITESKNNDNIVLHDSIHSICKSCKEHLHKLTSYLNALL